jgi:hypothetical protein
VQFSAWEQSLAVYRYRVPVAASTYEITLGKRAVPMAYEGKFWIDSRNLELKRLTIEVPNPPREAQTCRIETRIDYQQGKIGANTLALPQLTQLKLWDADGSRWENRTTYAGCRAFESESLFRTDMNTPDPGSPASAPSITIPPGLSMKIALLSRIDEARAYAGDAIHGQLLSDVRRPDGRLVAPQGTRLQGRIVRAERHLQPTRYFSLGLKFESITLQGAEVPLALEFAARSRDEKLWNGPEERRAGIGVFLFPQDQVELDAGFVSEWKTK